MDKVNCPVCGAYIKVPVNTDSTYHDFYCPVCDELLRSRVERHVTLEQRHPTSSSGRVVDAGAESNDKGYKELFGILAKGRSKPPPA